MSYQVDLVCRSGHACPAGKSIWPELLGKKGKEAKAVIEKERPDIDGAIYVSEEAFVTEDYCCNRVWIWLNCKIGGDYENAIVAAVPRLGDRCTRVMVLGDSSALAWT